MEQRLLNYTQNKEKNDIRDEVIFNLINDFSLFNICYNRFDEMIIICKNKVLKYKIIYPTKKVLDYFKESISALGKSDNEIINKWYKDNPLLWRSTPEQISKGTKIPIERVNYARGWD